MTQYWIVNWYGEPVYGPFDTFEVADGLLKQMPPNHRLEIMEQVL